MGSGNDFIHQRVQVITEKTLARLLPDAWARFVAAREAVLTTAEEPWLDYPSFFHDMCDEEDTAALSYAEARSEGIPEEEADAATKAIKEFVEAFLGLRQAFEKLTTAKDGSSLHLSTGMYYETEDDTVDEADDLFEADGTYWHVRRVFTYTAAALAHQDKLDLVDLSYDRYIG